MATLYNQGTFFYTPGGCSEQRSIVSNTTSTTVDVSYDFDISHGASPTTFATGDTITYTVVLNNSGSGSFVDISVIADANGELTYVSGSAEAFLYDGEDVVAFPFTVESGSVIFNFSEPLPGNSIVFLTYRATVNAGAGERVVSTATVTAREGDSEGDAVTDSDTAVITRTVLTVVKSAPESAEVGDTISFLFTIENSIDAPVSFDRLTDQLPDNFSFLSLALVINGVNVPLEEGEDYTVSDEGLLVLNPNSTVFIPAEGSATLTITGVVTA